jgi:hypothetical protein
MSVQEEQYIHFASCIDNLNYAWLILQDIKRSESSPLISPSFQFALIEYAKPYKQSVGELQRHKIDGRFVPPEHLDLHNRLLAARDKIHAHSDLTVMEAKLYVAKMSHGIHASIVQNVIHRTDELSNIDMIIDLIEKTLDSMYVEVKQLEKQLTPNMQIPDPAV